tara:strand:- start:74733 stop:75104 length:372 start_codon:yes stop_codon:yes gene_type:complete
VGLRLHESKSASIFPLSVQSAHLDDLHSVLSSGMATFTTVTFTISVTETLITLPDGRSGCTITVSTGSTTYTGYENAPPNTSTSETTTLALADITNGMGGDAEPARSSESILEEFRDRSEQVA